MRFLNNIYIYIIFFWTIKAVQYLPGATQPGNTVFDRRKVDSDVVSFCQKDCFHQCLLVCHGLTSPISHRPEGGSRPRLFASEKVHWGKP